VIGQKLDEQNSVDTSQNDGVGEDSVPNSLEVTEVQTCTRVARCSGWLTDPAD